MTDGPHYREIRPTGIAAEHVRCVWRLTGDARVSSALDLQPVLPDGCGEIVLHAGDSFVQRDADGTQRVQPRALVAGQLGRAMMIAPAGRIDVWGIRFHPWATAAFLGASAHELRDRVYALGDVAASFASDCETAVRQSHEHEREQMLMLSLERRARRVSIPHRAVPALVRMVEAAAETTTVSALGARVGISARRVQTVFRDGVGLSPKHLLRIARLQRALRIARRSPRLGLSAIAVRAGYFDHSHLVRDARDIAGMTPSMLLRGVGALTDVFVTDEPV